MSDGDIGEGLPGSPSQGGYSETNPIPVDNPPMPKPPSPTPPKPPKPSKPNLMDSLDLPPRRKLSPEECSLWSAVTRWEGVYNASSSTGLDGKFTPIDNTSLSSETKGSARLELEKDPTQSVENIRLVWKGTATLVEATHKTKTHVDLNPLNPVFGGKNDANESGSGNAGSVIEGDVYLTIDCYMGKKRSSFDSPLTYSTKTHFSSSLLFLSLRLVYNSSTGRQNQNPHDIRRQRHGLCRILQRTHPRFGRKRRILVVSQHVVCFTGFYRP